MIINLSELFLIYVIVIFVFFVEILHFFSELYLILILESLLCFSILFYLLFFVLEEYYGNISNTFIVNVYFLYFVWQLTLFSMMVSYKSILKVLKSFFILFNYYIRSRHFFNYFLKILLLILSYLLSRNNENKRIYFTLGLHI